MVSRCALLRTVLNPGPHTTASQTQLLVFNDKMYYTKSRSSNDKPLYVFDGTTATLIEDLIPESKLQPATGYNPVRATQALRTLHTARCCH